MSLLLSLLMLSGPVEKSYEYDSDMEFKCEAGYDEPASVTKECLDWRSNED